MSKRNLILEITNGIWMIEESYANSQYLLIQSFLKGNTKAFEKENAVAQFTSIDSTGKVTFTPKGEKPFSNADPLSTAVIFVSGPIMKYDNCGSAGTKTYSELILSAAANPNIGSILMVVDTPGGTVAGTEEFAKAVSSARDQKPVVSLVDGLLCSAGYWFASGSTEIYASNNTDMIGSIGTMCAFADFQKAYEKQGVVFHEVYADKSGEKNADFTEARKGNYGLIKARLNAINEIFLNHVTANRGDKLDKEKTLSGKVFMGEEAITVGLIDGFKSFDDAVARAQELAQSTNNNNQKQSKPMKVGAKFTALIAGLAASFPGFKADETELTAEHIEKMNADLATLATVQADLTAAQEAKTKLEGEKTALQTAHDGLVTKNTELTAEVDRMAKLNPGATAALKKGTDSVSTKDESNDFFCDADEDIANLRKSMYGE